MTNCIPNNENKDEMLCFMNGFHYTIINNCFVMLEKQYL